MNTRRLLLCVSILALLLPLAGCQKDAPASNSEPTTPKATPEPVAPKPTKAAAPAEKPGFATIKQPTGEPVTAAALGKSGARFEPPIEKSQVPDGAWFCDMGTVHYGQMHEGDGTCPLCKMKLVQKVASP